MHAYGHEWVCQLTYNPRMVVGLGLLDGEHLWSCLIKLIGIEHSSSVRPVTLYIIYTNRIILATTTNLVDQPSSHGNWSWDVRWPGRVDQTEASVWSARARQSGTRLHWGLWSSHQEAQGSMDFSEGVPTVNPSLYIVPLSPALCHLSPWLPDAPAHLKKELNAVLALLIGPFRAWNLLLGRRMCRMTYWMHKKSGMDARPLDDKGGCSLRIPQCLWQVSWTRWCWSRFHTDSPLGAWLKNQYQKMGYWEFLWMG